MKVDIDPDKVKKRKADSRGRVRLGPEYADEDVEVAILHAGERPPHPLYLPKDVDVEIPEIDGIHWSGESEEDLKNCIEEIREYLNKTGCVNNE